MKTRDFWENAKEELKALKEQRAMLSKKIHVLSVAIAQHERKPYLNPDAGRGSPCYEHFGKRYKDLTDEERREWARLRKAKQTAKQKNNKKGDKKQ